MKNCKTETREKKKKKEDIYTHKKRNAQTREGFKKGDLVLPRQDKTIKLTPNSEVELWSIVRQKGSEHAVEKNGSTYKRHQFFVQKFITDADTTVADSRINNQNP